MIRDARALRTETVPQDLHHRDGQIDHLSSVLTPVTHGDAGENVSVYGPSGAGKTTLVKYVLDKLKAEILDVRWGYVNCFSESSKQAVLSQLVRDASLGRDLRRSGTPTTAFLDRIREYDGQFIAVLDEVDMLAEPQLILALTDLPNVAVVTICIDEDQWLSATDDRVRTRLVSAETITLERYSFQELCDILDYRVTHGLDASRVTDDAVEWIADEASGNARIAIALLRRAAKHVVEHDLAELTADVVRSIADEARADVREGHVRSLGTHQRALYTIVAEAGSDGILASDLYDRYRVRVREPRSDRMCREYLESLERYDLVRKEGETRWTRYYLVE